jgi:hypothetical protein
VRVECADRRGADVGADIDEHPVRDRIRSEQVLDRAHREPHHPELGTRPLDEQAVADVPILGRDEEVALVGLDADEGCMLAGLLEEAGPGLHDATVAAGGGVIGLRQT